MADIVIPQPGDASGNGAGEDKKVFTQAELDSMFADRARRAADKATADLLSQVGVKTADELKTLVTQVEESRRSQMSELEKARSDALAASERAVKAEADKLAAVESANTRVIRSAIEDEARRAGFRAEALSDVVKLVDRSKMSVSDDAVEGVAEAVKAFAKGREFMLGDVRQPGGTPARQNRRAGAAPVVEVPHRSTVKL
jgi:dGTP triphosphohydrolase